MSAEDVDLANWEAWLDYRLPQPHDQGKRTTFYDLLRIPISGSHAELRVAFNSS
jgi:hypothetical protein